MATEKEIMRELHEIREKMYEETKHMTPEERMAFQQRDLDKKMKELGITLRRPYIEEPATVSR